MFEGWRSAMVAGGKIRVFLVDDEQLMREALLATFGRWTDIDMVGACEAVYEAPELTGQRPPDVIVVNLAGVRTASVALARQARGRWPQAKMVVLSPFCNEAFVTEVFRAGAHGYVTTQCAPHELLDAVRTVASGSRYLCSTIRQATPAGFARGDTDKVDLDRIGMTDREATILRLFGEGRNAREIAAMLNRSPKTIHASCRRLKRRFRLDSTVKLVKCAIVLGLTPVDA